MLQLNPFNASSSNYILQKFCLPFPPDQEGIAPMRYHPSKREVGNLRLKSLEVFWDGGSVCGGAKLCY